MKGIILGLIILILFTIVVKLGPYIILFGPLAFIRFNILSSIVSNFDSGDAKIVILKKYKYLRLGYMILLAE